MGRLLMRDNMRLRAFLMAALSMSMIAFATSDSCGQSRTVDNQGNAVGNIDPKKTYVLAIGCCVPWRGLRTCRDTVRLFVEAATARLGIPPENILTVVDEQATYEGVANGFTWLSRKSGPDKTIIVYYNGHGTLLPEGSDSGDPEYVFILWSKEFPFAGLQAVLAHIWMNDLEFSALVDKVPGKAKLVIADTCHALGAWEDLHPKGTKIDYGLKGAALIAASEAGQLAFSTPKYALFTKEMVAAMNSGVGNLKDAFDLAQRKTRKESRIMCSDLRKKTSKLDCIEQGPTLEDPQNIVPRFLLRNYGGKGAQR